MVEAQQLAPQGAIDCHAHVFTRTLPRIPAARYVPHRDAQADEYLALLDTYRLSAGVLIQPSFLGADQRHLLDALGKAPDRLRGIAVVARDAPPSLLDMLQESGVVGIRVNLIGIQQTAIEPFVSPGLLAEIRRRGWLLEVQAEGPRWVRLIPELARSGATVIVNHFGRPAGPGCPGFQAILEAAHAFDLRVKLSAPYRFGLQHAGACAAALHDAFGADRLLWGSDWPWTEHPEMADFGATLAWLAAWLPDPEVRKRVLVDNPRALYGFR